MKRKLYFLTLIICIFLSKNSNPSLDLLRDYGTLNDEELINMAKESFIHQGKESQEKNHKAIKNEILERMQKSPSKKLEYLMIKEIESPASLKKSRNEYYFQIFCARIINRAKHEETYDLMLDLLKGKTIYKRESWAERIIRKLTFERYTEAISVFEDIAYDDKYIQGDIERQIKISLAVIGDKGIKLIKDKFTAWENLPASAPEKSITPVLWPLGYSRDISALPIAWRHINNDDLAIRVQALGVIGCIGAKISDKHRKIFDEASKYPPHSYEFHIGCDELEERERLKIKECLQEALKDYYDNRAIRLTAARYLRYYPYPDVVKELNTSMNNDPYSFAGSYPVREEAKRSLKILKENYPELFEK